MDSKIDLANQEVQAIQEAIFLQTNVLFVDPDEFGRGMSEAIIDISQSPAEVQLAFRRTMLHMGDLVGTELVL